MINCDVIGHFYLLLFPLFNLCLTSQYFITSGFRFLSSILQFLFYDLPHTFLSSIFWLLFTLLFTACLLPYSIFHLYAPLFHFYFITSPFVHYSLPSLPKLNNSTLCSLWLCKSYFTFSILPHSLYYSEPCSIKFFLICTYFPNL